MQKFLNQAIFSRVSSIVRGARLFVFKQNNRRQNQEDNSERRYQNIEHQDSSFAEDIFNRNFREEANYFSAERQTFLAQPVC